MEVSFNVEEIFTIAVEIEKNGESFYRSAASMVNNSEIKQFLVELADWETAHISLFERLQNNLPNHKQNISEYFDPNLEAYSFYREKASNHIFLKNTDVSKLAENCKTPSDVIKMALSFEIDSVQVYSALKKMMKDDEGKILVDKIIKEEESHVKLLEGKLSSL